MDKITPHLWFDNKAKEAVEFYTSLFPHSKITNISTIHQVPTPNGDCDIVSFELAGKPFMAINAGPIFQFNPSISFMINFDSSTDPNATQQLDSLWEKLAENGKVLMSLEKYFFSDRYGWVQDRYGLTWQLILLNLTDGKRPTIMPSLLFGNAVSGRAEEAMNFYISIFDHSKAGYIARYPQGQEPNKEGTIMYEDFTLNDEWFAAMDNTREQKFDFNEAISFLIPCHTQKEIDYFWDKLSADPKSEQCGWLKDKFGVSWQVWPIELGEMFKRGSKEQNERLTKAFLNMKKFDIAKLQKAFEGK